MFVFALMGMEFFGGKFRFDDDDNVTAMCGSPVLGLSNAVEMVGTATSAASPENADAGIANYDCSARHHFDYFLPAFISVFQIFTGEELGNY
jgi:hypothetical protein